jgi:hypothetical protein
MGEIVNPAIAGIQQKQKSEISDLRAKADAWSARNDLPGRHAMICATTGATCVT